MSKEDDVLDACYDQGAAQIATEIDNQIINDIADRAGQKMIWTSSYARCGTHENALSISASCPPFYEGPVRLDLAPSWKMIGDYKTGVIDEDEYSKQYIRLLQQRYLTPKNIYWSLPHGTIMLCYEKAGDFCHRRVLASWLEEHLDVHIPEWQSEEEVKKSAIVDSLLDF